MVNSRKKRISVVLGTRPEAIKLAPLILGLKAHRDVECHVCVTGQHRQMLDQVLQAFDIVPDVDLRLMQSNQSLAQLTARAVEALDSYLAAAKPELVLVQGDTTTVFCGALCAFYRHIPVGHVEAGLRTWNLQAPWPEEANRVLASRLTTLHFAPTEGAKQNLLREGVAADHIWTTGNTAIDTLFLALDRIRAASPAIESLPWYQAADDGRPVVLITGHRRESFGEGFENICEAIAELAGRFPEARFVYPVHLNPNVREPVQRLLGDRLLKNVYLIEPMAYLPFVDLMSRCTVILTDSGGIQEEAPSLGKPVLVMRDSTERPEALSTGIVKLVGNRRERIVAEVSQILAAPAASLAQSFHENPYGDGNASKRILNVCEAFLAGDLPAARPKADASRAADLIPEQRT